MALMPLVAAIASASLLLTGGGFTAPAVHATPSNSTSSVSKLPNSAETTPQAKAVNKVQDALSNYTKGSPQETNKLRKKAISKNISTNSGYKLDYSRAYSLNTSNTKMLRVPFAKSADVLDQSGVSVFYNKSGNIESVGEFVLTPKTSHSGTVQLWNNNHKVVDRQVQAPKHMTNSTIHPNGFSWSKFNSCLASKGVAAWAITAISVACGAACAATAGAGCIVCAVAAAGISGTTIGTCAAAAMA